MGTCTTATCQCGVDSFISIGSGMQGSNPCYFPAACDGCHNVVEVNISAKKPRCPECKSTKVTPYTEPALMARAGKNIVTQWSGMELNDGDYFCPQCRQMTLHFGDGPIQMMWD